MSVVGGTVSQGQHRRGRECEAEVGVLGPSSWAGCDEVEPGFRPVPSPLSLPKRRGGSQVPPLGLEPGDRQGLTGQHCALCLFVFLS